MKSKMTSFLWEVMQALLICFQYKWKKVNNKAHKLQIVH